MISKQSFKLLCYMAKAYQPSGNQSALKRLQIQDGVGCQRDQDNVLSKTIDKSISRSRIDAYLLHSSHTKALCCKKTSIFSQNIWN
jgi:hypothetical protein